MWRPTQFLHGFSHCRAVIEDMLSDDTMFLKKMVDAVDALFRSHGPLQVGHHSTEPQERMVVVIWNCQRVAMHPSAENCARLRSSWADLNVRERRLFRKAVSLNETARNTALLEVTGMSVWNERLFFVALPHDPRNPSTLPSSHLSPRTLAGKEVHVVVTSAVRRAFFVCELSAFSDVSPSGLVM